MTDSTKQEGKKGKLESQAMRTIIVIPNKKRSIFEATEFIETLARKTIHNLSDVYVCNFPGNSTEYTIKLFTADSSYDLNGFYTELTKHGYSIQ